MLPKVYIETTIPSYLTSRTSRNIVTAGHQQSTHDWWVIRRNDFELFVSEIVIRECEAGDTAMAAKRLEIIADIPVLEIPQTVDFLAEQLITDGPLPRKAETDAAHIAIAATNGIDFLLTWNLRHIANAEMQESIRLVCQRAGFRMPVICTPEELLGEKYYVEG